jgi:uncharacterized membrane protein YhhN
MDTTLLIITAVLMMVLGSIYVAGRERNKRKVLAFKAAATLAADMLAVIAALQEKTVSVWFVAVGIFLYACADILLEIKFIWGILCFGVGHVWMIAGIGLQGISAGASVLIFVLLYGIAFFVFHPYFGRLKQLKMPGLIYAALLCMMSAAAWGAAITAGTMWSWARAVGSLCFVISDGIIGWTFIHRSRTRCSGAILMILYYLAVYLLGAAGL